VEHDNKKAHGYLRHVELHFKIEKIKKLDIIVLAPQNVTKGCKIPKGFFSILQYNT
jgi:hypothetical protein